MTGIVGIYVGKEAREGQLKEATQRVLRQPGYNGLLSRNHRARDRMERPAVLLLARQGRNQHQEEGPADAG